MTYRTYMEAKLAYDYLAATGDALTPSVCRALGIPSDKKGMYTNLRLRIAAIEAALNGEKELRLPIDVQVRQIIDRMSTRTFTTDDLRKKITLSSATLFKGLRSLESEQQIQRKTFKRPYEYERAPKSSPNYIATFMQAHDQWPSGHVQFSLRHLPLIANRALCGMSADVNALG